MAIETFEGTRYDFVEAYLAEAAGSRPVRIFDVGAGGSIIRDRLAGYSGPKYEFAEYDLVAKSDEVQQCDIENEIPGDGTADIVLLMDVVEHLWNPGKAMANVAAALRLGGSLVLTMPNPSWSRSCVRFLFQPTIDCFTAEDLELNHHVFTPWSHFVERLLANNGFTVTRHVTLESELKGPNRPRSLSYPLRWLAWCAARFIESRDPAAKGINYPLVATKSAARDD